MKLEKLEKSNQLFETYGFCLTPIQKKVLGHYLVDGLQITEIAEILGITKQAVSKNVVSAEKKLQNMENNLQFLAFQDKIKAEIKSLCAMAESENLQTVKKRLCKLSKEL